MSHDRQSTEREWLEGSRYEDKFPDPFWVTPDGGVHIPECDGYGCDGCAPEPVSLEKVPACPECEGSGEIHFMHRPPDPQTEDSARCGRCHGTGDWTPDG